MAVSQLAVSQLAVSQLAVSQLAVSQLAVSQLRFQSGFAGVGRLVAVDKARQAGLDGIELRDELRLPVRVTLFKAHRFSGIRTERLKSQWPTVFTQGQIYLQERFIGHMQFISQFSGEAHGHGDSRAGSNHHVTHTQPGKRRPAPVGAGGSRPHQGTGVGAGDN